VLEFAAEHRLVLAGHVAVLLGVEPPEAEARLDSLQAAGLVRDARRYDAAPPGDQITRAGLDAIGSTLPAPRESAPGGYKHDVGLAWLWLAARAGAFGPLRATVSERQMRSSDGRTEDRDQRFGVRLGGFGPGGRERLHYPDLVAQTASGHRVAFELELTSKWRARREGILAGYAADRNVDAVVYLVDKPSVGRAIAESANRLGISELVRVQRVSFDPAIRALKPGRAVDRARGVDTGRGTDRAQATRGVGTGRGADRGQATDRAHLLEAGRSAVSTRREVDHSR
jgi:hypothetical protein